MFGFFSSGLFLGWSLGANDASNVFGTAVASRMIRFRTAALYCSIFVILGAVISGAGASHTLGKLGDVNAVAGAFIVAFAAAMSVYLMTLARFPVSTSQAIVGAIIGWNMFSGSLTDMSSLTKIVSTWIICPLLAAGISMPLYLMTGVVVRRFGIHMFKLDALTRWSLLGAGIFGSYSLGANNIANVMGVFVPVAHLSDISLLGITFSGAQQLFLLGGIAIAIGVFTFSKRVMLTVGKGIFDLSPVMAAVVVWSHSIVLFLFSSVALESWLKEHGLPQFPLVPVSSSQAIVGAVIGIGLLKGGKSIRWKTVAGITSGWVTTPIIAALISLFSLFFLQNVFQQDTFRKVEYMLDNEAVARIEESGIDTKNLEPLLRQQLPNGVTFKKEMEKLLPLDEKSLDLVMEAAEIDNLEISPEALGEIKSQSMSRKQFKALTKLSGRVFSHRWQLAAALAEQSQEFQFKENEEHNARLNSLLNRLYNQFRQ
ncbi:MAG TPA: inorganic phosphate transporter [Desulfobacterales bacterium]|nr:inorganic phosphate transporter [Desulfobacterales bacterium]HIP38406.1 inorganic phosphate transporter [Desulfocapsa sulfexigens]